MNHPLRIEGDRLYLIGHGFAPKITVRMPDGTTREDVQAFLPRDPTTLLSEGAFKEYGKQGANADVGIEGFFAPTPADTGGGVITSVSPDVNNPILGIFIYQGTTATGLAAGVLARRPNCSAPVRRISRSVKLSGLPTALRSVRRLGVHGRAWWSRSCWTISSSRAMVRG